MTPIDIKRANRFRFLQALYEATDGNPTRYVSRHELGESIGLTEEETSDAFHFLRREGLIRLIGGRGVIVIEHEGVRQIENALQQPDHPTEYFPPVNIINIQSMHGSQIVQGSTQTTITNQPVTAPDIEDLRRLLTEIKELASKVNIEGDAKDEFDSECATIEAQLKSPRPKRTIIREGLASIRTILEGAAGEAIGAGLFQTIAHAIGNL